MLLATVDWTRVLIALIASLPGIIGALIALRINQQIKTPSGPTIGQQVERSHLTAIANNMLLSAKNGPTQKAEPEDLFDKVEEQPQVPKD